MNEPTVSIEDLVAVLRSSLGEDAARQALNEAADELGIHGQHLSHDEGLRMLERLAEREGLVGVTCRFARSRLMLKWASHNLGGRGTG